MKRVASLLLLAFALFGLACWPLLFGGCAGNASPKVEARADLRAALGVEAVTAGALATAQRLDVQTSQEQRTETGGQNNRVRTSQNDDWSMRIAVAALAASPLMYPLQRWARLWWARRHPHKLNGRNHHDV